jgi:hypothetical protein
MPCEYLSKRLLQSHKESAMNTSQSHEPWNKGKLIGQKSPLRLKDIWAIRFHLQQDKRIRDLALFNLAIDSKLRGCDLVDLRVRDISHGNQIMSRAMVMQRKINDQSSLSSQSQPAMRLLYGLRKRSSVQNSSFSQVGRKNRLTSPHGNMPESYIDGFRLSVWILRIMERTRCDVQRPL